jgi:hypothetical protein
MWEWDLVKKRPSSKMNYFSLRTIPHDNNDGKRSGLHTVRTGLTKRQSFPNLKSNMLEVFTIDVVLRDRESWPAYRFQPVRKQLGLGIFDKKKIPWKTE